LSGSSLPADLSFSVLVNGVVTQTLGIHASCSKPIAEGDVFGALTLASHQCSSQSTVHQNTVHAISAHAASAHAAMSASGLCGCNPDALVFTFSAQGCAATTNSQNGNAQCVDVGALTGTITVTSLTTGVVVANTEATAHITGATAGGTGSSTSFRFTASPILPASIQIQISSNGILAQVTPRPIF